MTVNYATTQDFIDILDIKNDHVVLKNGKVSAVMQLSSINFELLSVKEQDATISAFAGILNSLNFSVQVVIRSRAMNIDKYINRLLKIEAKITDPLLKEQALAYREFITNTIVVNKVLDKKFYLVVPSGYSEYENLGSGPFEFFSRLTGKQNKRPDYVNVEEAILKAKGDLTPKIGTLVREFEKIHITCRRLTTEELIKLYYECFKEGTEKSRLSSNFDDYTTPIVQPATV
ncbi:hypothetical protein EBU94_00415 [bacterium]|jgi:hypothetical protein|nr:hypothetical protein [bacterium]